MSETLAVVMPVHNEAESIEAVVRALHRDVVLRFDAVEVVVVDDASTDETPAILARLAAAASWLRVEASDSRRGHGPSVRHGLDLARADWIFELDSDGQSVVADFWSLWERRHDADLVLGVRADRHDPRHRVVMSRVLALLVSLLAGRRLHDANAPFRLIRRTVWEDVRTLLPSEVLALPTLISLGAVVRCWRVVEVPVSHRARASGHSTLRAFRLASFSLRAFVQLLAFRAALRRAPTAQGPG